MDDAFLEKRHERNLKKKITLLKKIISQEEIACFFTDHHHILTFFKTNTILTNTPSHSV